MDSNIWLGIFIAVMILLSAYFSATETAFSSLNKIRIKNMAQIGDKKAQLAYDIYEDYDRLLSTTLIGNNIVNIVATSLSAVLFTRLIREPNTAVGVSTIVMTVAVLVFGEISPKTLAKESPEAFAMFSAPIVRIFLFLLAPLNWLFIGWKLLLTKVFKPSDDHAMTEEELITIVDEAESEGGLDSDESELIRSAIEFNDIEVEVILTPRVDVVAIDEHGDMETAGKLFRKHGFSRIPVYRGSIDSIIGVLHEKDYYTLLLKNETSFESMIKPVVLTTTGTKIFDLLRLLQKQKSHMAVVLDEFGGTAGIVTLEDIIEELVGEIWDEHDEVVQMYRIVDDNTYIVSGNAILDDMFERLDIKKLDEDDDALNVNSWVTDTFERIPTEGEYFEYGPFTVTVTKVDFRRVVEVQIHHNVDEEKLPD